MLRINIKKNTNCYLAEREGVGFNNCNYSKAFIESSNNMNDVYKSIEEHNPIKEHKILIVFYDMMADMLSNKELQQIITEYQNFLSKKY